MTMLHPESDRTFYTEALTVPPGFRFDRAVALTYSLGLDTLLSVPLHLLLYADGRSRTKLVKSRLAILDGLRRTADSLAIFHQRGRILVPRGGRLLHSLLEEAVFPARAPGGGIFHPKVWLLRFSPVSDESTQAPGGGAPLIRLAVLSRNLTADRSWDVSLTVEGRRGSAVVVGNEDLVRLLHALPRLSPGLSEDRDRADWIASLAGDLTRTAWELPDGIDELHLRTIGLEGGGWLPPSSDRLVVMSPFCTRGAVERLAGTSRSPRALISRPEELVGIPLAALKRFEARLVLGEMAQSDDEEEVSLRRSAHAGLHAKLYVCEEGDATRLFVGSANATYPALVGATNVEVLAELLGSRARLGSVEEFLGEDGFGALLEDFDPEDVEEPKPDDVEAQGLIERACDTVADLAFRLSCRPADDVDGDRQRWLLELSADDSIELASGLRVTAWPITLPRERAHDCRPLLHGKEQGIAFGPMAVASLTRFIAFEVALEDEDSDAPSQAFVLRLHASGLPKERDKAVIVEVVREDGFLPYLLFLLGDLDGLAEPGEGGGTWSPGTGGGGGLETMPLLERMTRAFCRDPSRLDSVRRLVEDLQESDAEREDGQEILPTAFLELWNTFESALAGGDRE